MNQYLPWLLLYISPLNIPRPLQVCFQIFLLSSLATTLGNSWAWNTEVVRVMAKRVLWNKNIAGICGSTSVLEIILFLETNLGRVQITLIWRGGLLWDLGVTQTWNGLRDPKLKPVSSADCTSAHLIGDHQDHRKTTYLGSWAFPRRGLWASSRCYLFPLRYPPSPGGLKLTRSRGLCQPFHLEQSPLLLRPLTALGFLVCFCGKKINLWRCKY